MRLIFPVTFNSDFYPPLPIKTKVTRGSMRQVTDCQRLNQSLEDARKAGPEQFQKAGCLVFEEISLMQDSAAILDRTHVGELCKCLLQNQVMINSACGRGISKNKSNELWAKVKRIYLEATQKRATRHLGDKRSSVYFDSSQILAVTLGTLALVFAIASFATRARKR